MKIMICNASLIALSLLAIGPKTHAQDIRIVGEGADRKLPISLTHLKATSEQGPEREFLAALSTALNRSGWFSVTAEASAPLQIHGSIQVENGDIVAQAEVVNQATGKSYFSRIYRDDEQQPHIPAHALTDAVVEAVKGVPGIATTRIVMVGSREGNKDLYLIGTGGHDFTQLTRDGAPSLSPSWSPDAEQIYYTSFVRGFPDAYSIELASGRRTRVANYPGINAGATVSPNGRYLAIILSKEGNPELYVRDKRSGKLTRITRTPHASEASPTWSPDSQQIAYVSDSTGSPQVYVVSRTGGRPVRISFRGRENVSPSWGPDGRIAYSSRRDGRYQICIYNPTTREEQQLTRDPVDHENPSWAPNARHIVYSRTEGYSSAVYILDTLGDPQVRLTAFSGDWYFPAWSPR